MAETVITEPVAGTTQTGDVKPDAVAPEPGKTNPDAGKTPSEGDVKPDTKPAGTEATKKVPEKYDLKLPEGSLLDPAVIAKKSEDAKARGLSNEEAQGELERENAILATYVDGQKEAWNKQTEAWITEWKNDKEIGGAEFEKNAELAKRVINKFGDEALKKELNETGFGNHPGLGRLLVKLGKAMSEDQLVMPGSQPTAERKSSAEVLYGNNK